MHERVNSKIIVKQLTKWLYRAKCIGPLSRPTRIQKSPLTKVKESPQAHHRPTQVFQKKYVEKCNVYMYSICIVCITKAFSIHILNIEFFIFLKGFKCLQDGPFCPVLCSSIPPNCTLRKCLQMRHSRSWRSVLKFWCQWSP